MLCLFLISAVSMSSSHCCNITLLKCAMLSMMMLTVACPTYLSCITGVSSVVCPILSTPAHSACVHLLSPSGTILMFVPPDTACFYSLTLKNLKRTRELHSFSFTQPPHSFVISIMVSLALVTPSMQCLCKNLSEMILTDQTVLDG